MFQLPPLDAVKDLLPTYYALSSSKGLCEGNGEEGIRSASVQPHVPIKEPVDDGEFKQKAEGNQTVSLLNCSSSGSIYLPFKLFLDIKLHSVNRTLYKYKIIKKSICKIYVYKIARGLEASHLVKTILGEATSLMTKNQNKLTETTKQVKT